MILRAALNRLKFRKRLIWLVLCGFALLFISVNQEKRWSARLEDDPTYPSNEREERTRLLGSGGLPLPRQKADQSNVGHFQTWITTPNASSIDVTSESFPPMVIYLDEARRSLQAWRKDRQCGGFKVRFCQFETLPKCGLTSYPGSGNTWLRGLIEGATGIFTGSVYDDGQLYLADWPSFVHIQLKQWLETFIHWVTEGKDVLVVHYENLRQNLRQELKRIMSFLRVPIDELRLNCTLKNSHKGFRRKGQRFPNSLTIFPKETRNKLDRAIRYASFLLRKHGHQPPPLVLYEFYNSTPPKEVSFVACEEEESLFECDARVDEINLKIGFEDKRIKFLTAKSRSLGKM